MFGAKKESSADGASVAAFRVGSDTATNGVSAPSGKYLAVKAQGLSQVPHAPPSEAGYSAFVLPHRSHAERVSLHSGTMALLIGNSGELLSCSRPFGSGAWQRIWELEVLIRNLCSRGADARVPVETTEQLWFQGREVLLTTVPILDERDEVSCTLLTVTPSGEPPLAEQLNSAWALESPFPLLAFDQRTLRVVSGNAAMQRLTGRSQAELLAAKVTSLLPSLGRVGALTAFVAWDRRGTLVLPAEFCGPAGIRVSAEVMLVSSAGESGGFAQALCVRTQVGTALPEYDFP